MMRIRNRILQIIYECNRPLSIRELTRLVYGNNYSLGQLKYVSRIVKELAKEGKVDYKFLGNKSIVKPKKVMSNG